MTRRVRRPWVPVAAVTTVVLALLVPRALGDGAASYTAELPHAAGLRAGDVVRVAGLEVGSVESVEARGDTVEVGFELDEDAGLTADTTSQVKLVSLLGERYLDLAPGDGPPLDDGGTIPADQAVGSYTLERFWLEGAPRVEQLDLEAIGQAVDTLSTDLATAPGDVRAALDGMTRVSDLVAARGQQLDDLLASTRSVTSTLIDQQDELDALTTDAGLVLRMVVQRREAIRLLLRDGRRLVTRLTGLVRTQQGALEPALRDARTVLGTLTRHRRDLDRLLEMSGPSMRAFTNATGDGPWLGVNSPYFVFPDDFICTVVPKGCS